MQNEKDFEKLKYDESLEWWRPSKQDGYSLEKKLFRAGCRTIQRKVLECSRDEDVDYKICLNYQKEFDKCQQLLTFLYQTKGNLE